MVADGPLRPALTRAVMGWWNTIGSFGMSVVAHDAVAQPPGAVVVPVRPAWFLGVFLDALLGVGAYIASYWLRFDGERLAAFLPGAWATLPVVAGAQLLALAALQAYAPKPKASWLSRVFAG